MKIKNFLLIFLLEISFFCTAQSNLTFEEVKNLGLNVLVIQTENSETPSCEYVSSPAGSMGKSITNATKVPGSLSIYSPDGDILYDSGEYEKGESGMTIKIRGNTSAYASKKPYKIKLQKKADLLYRGDKNFNDKNWVLLNDNKLKLKVGFEISQLLEEDWIPQGMYVNVIMNDEYKGLYYLIESIERNEKARMNISEEGFVAEHDAYWWNENGEYVESYLSPLLNYTFKYPDYEEISKESLENISEILKEYEKSIREMTYETCIDLDSFAKWILGHDILGTWDGGGANLYLSRSDLKPGSKIKAGPLWDFDTIELQENLWSGVHTAFNRFDNFFIDNDTPFMKVYLKLWKEKGEEIYNGILSLIADFRDENKWGAYKASSIATSAFWGSPVDLQNVADRDEEWFIERFKWLKSQLGDFNEIDNEGASIAIIKGNEQKPVDVYNLQGLRILSKATNDQIKNLPKGIYIIENKKISIP